MKRLFLLSLIIIAISVLASCKSGSNCNRKDVCIKINKYTFENKTKLCIKLINNSDNDIYITGLNRLVFGLNVVKELNGTESDARFEFYEAPYGDDEPDGVNINKIYQKPDYSKERKICNVENYGPISRSGFEDTLANELLNFIKPDFYLNTGYSVGDTIWQMKRMMDCIFIPKHSEVSDGYEICKNKIDFEKLSIQFYYPNTNMDEFNLWFGGNSPSIRKIIKNSQINYPDTLLGYIHYTTPISSEIIEICK
jgi:hypothetical protein